MPYTYFPSSSTYFVSVLLILNVLPSKSECFSATSSPILIPVRNIISMPKFFRSGLSVRYSMTLGNSSSLNTSLSSSFIVLLKCASEVSISRKSASTSISINLLFFARFNNPFVIVFRLEKDFADSSNFGICSSRNSSMSCGVTFLIFFFPKSL